MEPDLLNYLKSVIDSEVSNLVRSDEHRLTQYPSIPHEGSASAGLDRATDSPTAEQILEQVESVTNAHDDFARWMDELERACAPDADERAVLAAYRDLARREAGPLQVAHVARALAWKESRVANARRRIERKTRQIRARPVPGAAEKTRREDEHGLRIWPPRRPEPFVKSSRAG